MAAKQKTGRNGNGQTLVGRTLYIPHMAYAGGRLLAAAFRSVGVDATVTPDFDDETLVLAGLHSGGDECLPYRITLGNFLKICRQPDFDPGRAAFFMATANGPCRFGQYARYLKQELGHLGYGDVMVYSPCSDDGYDGINEHATDLMRNMWMAVTCGDLSVKFLYKTRPYEINPGDADRAYRKTVHELADAISPQDLTPKRRYKQLIGLVEQMRDRFRAIPANYVKGRPLIGIVGEIFCRLNDFANLGTLDAIERHGGECWMSEFSEWVWYSNWGQANTIREQHGRLSLAYLKFRIKTAFQRHYSHGLRAPVADDLKGYEEARDIRHVLDAVRPYLPPEGCLGEMVLSVGQTIHMHRAGADGVIDISPFTCMNGAVCEAVYPSLGADHDGFPIRSLYFDGTHANVERDVEIFLDLVRAYQKRKNHDRVYPSYFT
jgi:predicted nucleotide-binding protein (sugar kinase/HSP70/actin superfamily)